MTLPIWRDYIVDLGDYLSGGKVSYIININGHDVYHGTAYEAPDGSCEITINDIVASFLQRVDLPRITAAGTQDTAAVANVQILVGGSVIGSAQFWDCWDYHTSGVDTANLNRPIKYDYVPGMKIIVSSLNNGVITHTLTPASSSPNISDYNNDFNDDYGARTEWHRVDNCDPSALYYANSLGGWDMLLLSSVKKMADYERQTMKQPYYNGDARNRGTRNYLNAVTERFECFTGRIQRTERMGELLGSTDVYLWDIANGFRPVVLTDTSLEMPTYKQNGKQPKEYRLIVELAQDKMRR